MDYIQEELLRQKKLLTALMVGEVRFSSEETPEETTARRDEMLTSQNAPERDLRVMRRSAHEGAAGSRRTIDRETEIETDGSGRVLRLAERDRSARADAQAVSRMIQRDARRYDGGFSLY